MDLALNNLQWSMCYKTKPNQSQTKQAHLIILLLVLVHFVVVA